MKAMIFAAGFGTRLRPITTKTPKVLVTVKGRSLLDWITNHLISCGVSEILINTHHLHIEMESYLRQTPLPVPIKFTYEQNILGTGGGLYETRGFWGEDNFIAYNGDVLCNANMKSFIDHHNQSNALVSMAVTKRKSESMLLADQNNALVGVERKGKQIYHRSPFGSVETYHFSGIYIISPKIFSLITPPVEFSLVDQQLQLVKEGENISVWDIGDAYWESIEDKVLLDKANKEFPG